MTRNSSHRMTQVLRQLREAISAVERTRAEAHPPDLACVVDGKALQVLLRPENKGDMLRLGMQCKVPCGREAMLPRC